MKQYGTENWKVISEFLVHHSEKQCLHRWQSIVSVPLVRGGWTAEEDQKISEMVAKHGAKKWSFIATSLPGRKAKQCRERWHNHLHPGISKGDWTEQEDRIIIETLMTEGNRWADMAKKLPGRYVFVRDSEQTQSSIIFSLLLTVYYVSTYSTDNAIKNHWNASMRRKVKKYLAMKQGVDEVDIRHTKDGRIDFMGDLEGILAAVRMPKSDRVVGGHGKSKATKPEEEIPVNSADKMAKPEAKPVKITAKTTKPKVAKASTVAAKATKHEVKFSKSVVKEIKQQALLLTSLKSPRYSSMKVAFARKDRVTVMWVPREPEPNMFESNATEMKGPSSLLLLASCAEPTKRLKYQSDLEDLSGARTSVHFDENSVGARRLTTQNSCQSIRAPRIESIREGVSC